MRFVREILARGNALDTFKMETTQRSPHCGDEPHGGKRAPLAKKAKKGKSKKR
ncbi:MAG TPA: hypothetical protein VI999_06910 [Thermoplasmata archaeon]|nr:hypothetical protein [Thermoplasmata archaeon]